jgi:lipopolysaccharide export system protein LptA
MNRHFTHTIFLLLILTLTGNVLKSQTQIEIVNADEIYFNKKISAERQVLIGQVKAKHENRFLTCDSAYFYSNDNRIEAFSNIHIWEGDRLNLYGEYLSYQGNEQVAEMENNVQFQHNQMQLTTNQLEYRFETQKGIYENKALITEKEKSLESNAGIYYAIDEKFDFYGHVVIENLKNKLYADTVFYWLNKEYAAFKSNGIIENDKFHVKAQKGWLDQKKGEAFLNGQIKITDLENLQVLYADTTSLFKEMNQSLSYGSPLLSIPLSEDTLYLTADTLIQEKVANHHLIKAYPQVKFKTSEMLGSCDSISYNSSEERMYMYEAPVVWIDDFQLSADTLSMQLLDNTIEWALFDQNAFIASKVDSAAYNQIGGEDMTAHFSENELSNIEVLGNGESIYFITDEESKKPKSMNKIICSNMNILIKERSIEQINFYEKPNAVLYPISQVQGSERQLKKFQWIESINDENKIETLIEQIDRF